MDKVIDSFRDEYAFLSNFYPSPIEYEGRRFPTVEHAYQAYKSLDPDIFDAIANAPTPGSAKRAGASVVHLRPSWEKFKLRHMLYLVEAKFTQNPDLRDQLLATGDAHLEEGNTWGDTYWGTVKGKGENKLGEILMLVRRMLCLQAGFYKDMKRCKS